MSVVLIALVAVVGAALVLWGGVALGRFLARSTQAVEVDRARSAVSRAAALEAELAASRREITELTADNRALRTRLEEAVASREALTTEFQAVASEVFHKNSESFLRLAESRLQAATVAGAGTLEEKERAIAALVDPIKALLDQTGSKLSEIERERLTSTATLTERLEQMALASSSLQGETRNLVKALRTPNVRGRWGEVTLRRVCEIAGMLERVDFVAQVTTDSDQGRLRPDLVVRLPGNRSIVVDAKAPLVSYLDAVESANDETRQRHLAQHAQALRSHIDQLSRKAYWDQFEQTPDMVVLFLPAESLMAEAVAADPTLVEESMDQRVVLATPTTLIALLKAVSYGWQRDAMTQNAFEIAKLGRELHGRLAVALEHLSDVGTHLGRAIGAYNKTVGSVEQRVLPSARRFRDLGATGADELKAMSQIEHAPRQLMAPERTPGSVAVVPGAEHAPVLPALAPD